MNSKGRLLLVLPLVLVLVGGCSHRGAHARLSGKVTYKGQPVTGGVITFLPQSGGAYTANLDANGTYSIADLPAGEVSVGIETESVKRQATVADYNKGHQPAPPPGANANSMGAAGGAGSAAPATKYVKIPAKYSDPKTSGLSVSVTGGGQDKDFDLTD